MPNKYVAIRNSTIRRASSSTRRSDHAHRIVSEMAAHKDETLDECPVARGGQALKFFLVQNKDLVTVFPFLGNSGSYETMSQTGNQLSPPSNAGLRASGLFAFPDFDEFTCLLFQDWFNGKGLEGPYDFHSMTHYLSLYVLGLRFQNEPLRNKTIDLIRAYYDKNDMSAPAFRLDYIYASTTGPNPMRNFLVYTAASRASTKGSNGQATGISDSVRNCLQNGGDLAVDYAKALVELAKNPDKDVRRGISCEWHEHEVSDKCSYH